MQKIALTLSVVAMMLAAQPGRAEEQAGGDASHRSGRHGHMLQEMDKDGNGSVSKEEFLAGAEARFTRMDKNGDGVLTKDDMPARPEGGFRRPQGEGGAGEGAAPVPGVTLDKPAE